MVRIREEEKRLFQTYQSWRTHLGIWVWDFDKDLTWDSATREVFGLENAEDVSIGRYWSHVHPDDRQRDADAIHSAIEDSGRYAIEKRIYRTDGSMRLIRTVGEVQYDYLGRPVRMLGTCIDITDMSN